MQHARAVYRLHPLCELKERIGQVARGVVLPRLQATEQLDAVHQLARLEGILPALESAHAVAWLLREGGTRWKRGEIVLNLSGRGDKDLATILAAGAGA